MLSVIILAYNRCAEVLATIDLIKTLITTLPFDVEIIVVDNLSTDNSSAEIRRLHPDVTLITRDINNGIAGWNDGFAIARYKYFLVLDDDSHVHSGLTEAINYLEVNQDVGILGLQIKDPQLQDDQFLDPESAWKNGEDIPGFIGCGAIIRKDVYQKIGGFAEWLFVYTHEFEYTIRCLDAGFKVKFFAGTIVIHRASTINRSNRRLRIFGTRNEMAIVHKYFRNQKFKYLFRTLINNLKFVKREGLSSFYYVLQGAIEYLKIRETLTPTPVSQETQKYYAANFWSTKPIFTAKNK